MKKLIFLFCTLIFMSLVSCTSESDKLEGKWSCASSILDDFVKNRIYQTDDTRKAYINYLSFSKETKNSGSFTSLVTPISVTPILTPDENESGKPIFIGSKITGTWEIKDKKLYMNFGSAENIQLNGSNFLNQREKEYVKSQIYEKFWKYIAPATNGMEFNITKDGKKDRLRIYFGNQIVEFYKAKK